MGKVRGAAQGANVCQAWGKVADAALPRPYRTTLNGQRNCR